MDSDNYLLLLKGQLRKHANPDLAVGQKKYLLNQFEFFGITSPQRQVLSKYFYAQYGLPEDKLTIELIKKLWKEDQRELQYVALDILERKMKKGFDTKIEVLENLILTKSWWDTVDFITPKLAGPIYIDRLDVLNKVANRWVDSGNRWLIRSSLLVQLKYKEKTDFDLMCSLIKKCAGESDFFIRKGIGWVLREYSKTNPTAVSGFVKKQKLSPLSRKEAMKIIDKE